MIEEDRSQFTQFKIHKNDSQEFKASQSSQTLSKSSQQLIINKKSEQWSQQQINNKSMDQKQCPINVQQAMLDKVLTQKSQIKQINSDQKANQKNLIKTAQKTIKQLNQSKNIEEKQSQFNDQKQIKHNNSLFETMTPQQIDMLKQQINNTDQIQNQTNIKLLSKSEKIKIINLRINAAEQQRMAGRISLALNILSTVNNKSTICQEEQMRGTVPNIQLKNKGMELLYISKLAKAFYYIEQYQKALQIYQNLLKKLPKQYVLYQGTGDCLRHLGKFIQAIQVYSNGIKLSFSNQKNNELKKSGLLNSRGLSYLNSQKYDEAILDFMQAARLQPQNPLYFCHLGCSYQFKGQRQYGMNYFMIAKDLIENSSMHHQLESSNIMYINHKIKTFIQKLNQLNALKTKDSLIQKRINNFTQFFIDLNIEDQQLELEDKVLQIQSTNELIEFISLQGNEKLYQFYDGSLFTLCQSYSTSRVVLSNVLQIHTHSIGNQLIKQILHFVPLVGAALVPIYENVHYYQKKSHFQRAANNICKMATTQSQFEAIAQDAICKFIKQNVKQINNLNFTQNNLKNWVQRFKSLSRICKQQYQNFIKKLFGQRNQTQMQKYGYKIVCQLVQKFISNGQIYQKKPSIRMRRQQKVKKLSQKLQQILRNDLQKEKCKLKNNKQTHLNQKQTTLGQKKQQMLIQSQEKDSHQNKIIKLQQSHILLGDRIIPYDEVSKVQILNFKDQKVIFTVVVDDNRFSFKMNNASSSGKKSKPLKILYKICMQKLKTTGNDNKQTVIQNKQVCINKSEQKKNKILYQGPIFKSSQTLGIWGERFVCISQQRLSSFKNGEQSFEIQSKDVKGMSTQFKKYEDKIVFRIDYTRSTDFSFDLLKQHNDEKLFDAFFAFCTHSSTCS